jgi:hypothetical protein
VDKFYSAKLVDLWKAQGSKEYELDDVMLLKVGRHIRPAPHFKLIVAREEGEARFLEGYKKDFISLLTVSHNGPLVLLDGEVSAEDLHLAARITARFGQGREAEQVEVAILDKTGIEHVLTVTPLTKEEFPKSWYI